MRLSLKESDWLGCLFGGGAGEFAPGGDVEDLVVGEADAGGFEGGGGDAGAVLKEGGFGEGGLGAGDVVGAGEEDSACGVACGDGGHAAGDLLPCVFGAGFFDTVWGLAEADGGEGEVDAFAVDEFAFAVLLAVELDAGFPGLDVAGESGEAITVTLLEGGDLLFHLGGDLGVAESGGDDVVDGGDHGFAGGDEEGWDFGCFHVGFFLVRVAGFDLSGGL